MKRTVSGRTRRGLIKNLGKSIGTYNFLTPELSLDFFHGASSGSYGSGPCTGGSSSSASFLSKKIENYVSS